MSKDQGNQLLAQNLLDSICTTSNLKSVSDTLETISQNEAFKKHANAIVTDLTLTDGQKQTQLNYLIRHIENTILYDFFTQQIRNNQLWLFRSDKIDYLDKFVQSFQMLTEQIEVVFMTTAINLSSSELKQYADDLTKFFTKKVIINHLTDNNILGGVQLRIQNMVYDFSIRSKIHQFRRQWLKSITETEKKVGRNQV